MKRLFLILLLMIPVGAMAQSLASVDALNLSDVNWQDVAKNSPPKSSAKVEESKPKPIILDKVKLLELSNLRLVLENAQLKVQAAIPADLTKAMKDAGDAVAKFWQTVGINPEELATKWQATNGVDGAVILTPVEPKKDVAPETKPK